MRLAIFKRIVIAVFVFLPVVAGAQEEQKEEMTLRDRIFFGGNFSLQIGTVTFIEISPIVGYRFTPRFASGTGVTYQYYRDRRLQDFIFKTNIYGGRIFSQYLVIRDLDNVIPLGAHFGVIGYAEYEALNLERTIGDASQTGRFWLSSLYVGGGLEIPMGRRTKMNFLVLWNLNDTGQSPYTNPSVRIGIVF